MKKRMKTALAVVAILAFSITRDVLLTRSVIQLVQKSNNSSHVQESSSLFSSTDSSEEISSKPSSTPSSSGEDSHPEEPIATSSEKTPSSSSASEVSESSPILPIESDSSQSSDDDAQKSSDEGSSITSSSESSEVSYYSYPDLPLTGYYAGISETATGSILKTALCNLIKGHTNKGYDFAYEAYQTTDVDENGKIIDIYSNQKFDPVSDHQGAPGKSNYSKEGDCYNREHTIPQSVFSEGQPMKSDLHHLLPTDGYANNRRSNYPHAEVATATWTSSNGCKLGNSVTPGYSDKAFEVPDQYKGDIARIYFYMVTRYQESLSSWKTFAAFSKNSYPSLSSWAITLYLKWSDMDPVSEKEIKRNDAVYAYQKNRNPFVDHPEFAHKIWDGAN